MWTARILQLIPQLYLVPYLINKIGDSGYGVYALIWSLLLSIETLQRSLQSGVVKYSAAFLAQGKMEEVNKTVSSSFVFSCIMAVVICCTILSICFFHNNPSEIKTSLIITSVIILFLIPLTPYVAVIQAKQYYYVGALVETASKYLGLSIILISFQITTPSVAVLVVIMGSMLIISKAVQVPISHHLLPGLKNQISLFNRSSFQLILAYGSAIVLASACLAANSTGIRWLMNSLVSPEFVAHMAIMIMPSILLSQIVNPLAVTIMPATSSYEATGNHVVLQKLLSFGVSYVTILVLAGLITAIYLMRHVLELWVGVEYIFLTPYATVLFASVCFKESTAVAHHMLKGLGKLRSVITIYLISLVLIPIFIILILFKIYDNPYIAVTVGLISGNFVCGLLQLGACIKVVQINRLRILSQSYVKPIFMASFSYAVINLGLKICGFGNLDGLIMGLFLSCITVLSFIYGWYKFISTKEEREYIGRLLKSLRQKTQLLS